MPYLNPANRRALTQGENDPETPGELNFAITLELIAYMDRMGLSYETINDILGALEGAKLEFYRRVAVPFEETKIAINGDLY